MFTVVFLFETINLKPVYLSQPQISVRSRDASATCPVVWLDDCWKMQFWFFFFYFKLDQIVDLILTSSCLAVVLPPSFLPLLSAASPASPLFPPPSTSFFCFLFLNHFRPQCSRGHTAAGAWTQEPAPFFSSWLPHWSSLFPWCSSVEQNQKNEKYLQDYDSLRLKRFEMVCRYVHYEVTMWNRRLEDCYWTLD